MSINQGNWLEITPLKTARSHPAVVSYDEKLFVFGGGGPNFLSLDDCVVFDPAINRWESIAPMPTKRSGTVGFLFDNKIYVIGGGFKKPDGNFQFLRTVEIYDPSQDSWTSGPDMLQPHDYPAAACTDDAIYVLGGHHPDACLGGPKTDPGFAFCERYSPGNATWQRIADLPTPRFAASGYADNGKIHTCGGVAFTPQGFNNFDFFEIYDIQEDKWQKNISFHLPWPAAGHGLHFYNGNIFFFGGYSTDNIHARAAISLQGNKPWQRLPDMPMPRAAMGVAQIQNEIYLVGGWMDDGRTPMSSVVKYHW